MVRVGIIGCGSITKFRHAPEYAANPDVRILGFYDPVPGRAEEFAAVYGGKAYGTCEEMYADTCIDAVSVCTSNKYHAPVSIAALRAGKHVLCEKPMAMSLKEAEDMIKTADETGRYLMIGHNQRLVPAHRKVKEILNSGEMGRIISFRSTFGHGGPEAWCADKGAKTWFFKKSDAFMGAMGDLGIHKADLIRWILEDEIVEVQAMIGAFDKKDEHGNLIEIDDNAVCLLKSGTGIFGTLSASWTYYGEEDNSTVLYCTNGIIRVFDNPEFPVVVIKKNKEKVFFKVEGIQSNDKQTKSGIIDLFAKCVNENTPPEISGEDGFAALKIILGCMESAEKGCRIVLQAQKN